MYMKDPRGKSKFFLASFPRLTKFAAKNVSLTNPTYWFPEPNYSTEERGFLMSLDGFISYIPWSHDFPLANAVATAAPLATVGTYTVLLPIGD
jgi:hypothetical protein